MSALGLPISNMNAPLVLVVDDNADMRSYVERILQERLSNRVGEGWC